MVRKELKHENSAPYSAPTLAPIYLFVSFVAFFCNSSTAQTVQLARPTRLSAIGAEVQYRILGTGDRNNPIRQKLSRPFTGQELFVRFRLRYRQASIDLAGDDGDGEFLVLWLDKVEGVDTSTHATAPNIGIHVDEGKNRFMVRFSSAGQRFATAELVGDREFLLVARLFRSKPNADFDRLALWVDPKATKREPDAVAQTKRGLKAVEWIGVGTGRKTEADDEILIWDVGVGATWSEVLKLMPNSAPRPTRPPPKPRTVRFVKDVLPILKRRCFECHQGDRPKSQVRLDFVDAVIEHAVPGAAKRSRLIQLIQSKRDERMPPKTRPALTSDELATLVAWVNEGLDWDSKQLPQPVIKTEHWAFQPIRRPQVPKLEDVKTANAIDAFILKRQKASGIKASKPADSQTLKRRLSLALTGLPIDAHKLSSPVADWPDALMGSREFAEHWARKWLDVARWAESNGHQHNRRRAYAWRYRDYVIDAIHTNKPFDRFVREQVAGDLLKPVTPESITATGFLAGARYSGNELDKTIQRNDILVDVANTTAQAFLGLTFECAQCHSHKFDPISLSDYYAFQAFFSDGQPANVLLPEKDSKSNAREMIRRHWQLFDATWQKEVERKRRRGVPEPILVVPAAVKDAMRGDVKKEFRSLEKKIAGLPQAWAYYSITLSQATESTPHNMRWPLPRGAPDEHDRAVHLLIRGDTQSAGPRVSPAIPRVFKSPSVKNPNAGPMTRRDLAKWMTAKENPLTARVWVNRIWQGYFGRGLVLTSGDFGTQGTMPTHPSLLDWLASELIDSGWNSQHIHRLIVSSDTFRRSSDFNPKNHKMDPANRLYWRWQPRRVTAEVIRDSMLQLAGVLEKGSSGPPESLDDKPSRRRSIFLAQERDRLAPFQKLFDAPAGVKSCARRRTSTVPLQPLFLMNSPFAQRIAGTIAKRMQQEPNPPASVLQLILGRKPSSLESQRLQAFVKEESLQSLVLVLLNTNEFLYIP